MRDSIFDWYKPRARYGEALSAEELELLPIEHPREFQSQQVALPPIPVLRDVVEVFPR